MNLFEDFNTIVDNDFISKIRPNLGEDLGDIHVAIEGIYYTLVAGMIRRTNSDMSSGMLYNQIKEKYKQSFQTDNIREALLKPDNFKKITDNGLKVISQIFPAYKSPLISMISTHAGTNKNNTVICSGITASILINLLGNKIKTENLTKEDLVHYIKSHHEPLFKDVSPGLLEKMIPALGLQELNQMKYNPNQKKNESKAGEEEASSTSFDTSDSDYEESNTPLLSKKMLIGLVSAVIIGGLGYFIYINKDNISFLNGNDDKSENVMVDETLLDAPADTVSKAAKDSLVMAVDSSVKISPKVELQGFIEYIGNKDEAAGKEFDLGGIQFKDQAFEVTETTLPVVDELAKLMVSHPDLQLKITGFDPAGDAKIATKRAFTVKRILQEKGVQDLRIDAGSGGKGGNSPKVKVIKK